MHPPIFKALAKARAFFLPMNEKKFVELGVCKSPHGVKGGFTFYLHNPDDSILEKGTEVLLFPLDKKSSLPKDGKNFKISQISFGNKVIVYFDGIADRNIVEAMIPFSVQISREEFPEAEEGEFYLVDIIGALVFNHKNGEKIGVIDSFYENGPQLIAVVRGEESYELPFIDAFFPVIDSENKRIEMNVPEYLDE